MPKNDSKPSSAAVAAAPSAGSFDRRLVVAVCDSGKAGKSTMVIQLTEWLLRHGNKPLFKLFDPDTVHKTLARVYGEDGSAPLQAPYGLEIVDWRGVEGEIAIDRTVRALFEGETDETTPVISLVDGVANQMNDVVKWVRSARVFDLGVDLRFRTTFIVVVDETADSVDSAARILQEAGSRADYVIVRNTKKLARLPWDGFEKGRELAKQYNAIEITMPPMTLDVQKYTDAQLDGRPHSLYQAAHGAKDRFIQTRAVTLLDLVFKEFDRAEPYLVPPQFVRSQK